MYVRESPLRPESPEELRERLRQMSDLELRRFGQRARKLSDPKMNFGATDHTSYNLKRRGRSGADDIRRKMLPRR